MKKTKRIIALILAVTTVFSVFTFSVAADAAGGTDREFSLKGVVDYLFTESPFKNAIRLFMAPLTINPIVASAYLAKDGKIFGDAPGSDIPWYFLPFSIPWAYCASDLSKFVPFYEICQFLYMDVFDGNVPWNVW